MIEQDIETVYLAIVNYADEYPTDGEPAYMAFERIRDELERLRERALPELPEGCFLFRLGSGGTGKLYRAIVKQSALVFGNPIEASGTGPTPRASVQAAIDKIKEQQ